MLNLLGATQTTGLNIFETMIIFFANLREFVIPEYVLYGAFGLLLLIILITLVISNKTYEVKVLQYVKKSNKYFKKNPQINEDNLIYVNNNFKKRIVSVLLNQKRSVSMIRAIKTTNFLVLI